MIKIMDFGWDPRLGFEFYPCLLSFSFFFLFFHYCGRVRKETKIWPRAADYSSATLMTMGRGVWESVRISSFGQM